MVTNRKDIIEAYLMNELDEKEALVLVEWLRADKSNVEEFVRATHVHSVLKNVISLNPDLVSTRENKTLTSTQGTSLKIARRNSRKGVLKKRQLIHQKTAFSSRIWPIIFASAACVALVFGLFLKERNFHLKAVASLTSASHGTKIFRKSKSVKIVSNMQIYDGDVIDIPSSEKSSASIRYLNENTMLDLKSGTKVKLSLNNGSKVLELEKGSIFVDVAKQAAGKPMKLFTEYAKMVVLGTKFSIDVLENNSLTRLKVKSGLVRCINRKTNKAFDVSANFYADTTYGNIKTGQIQNIKTGSPRNIADANVNLALSSDARLSANAGAGQRGGMNHILYDPAIGDYAVTTYWNEYGVAWDQNLGTVDINGAFFWMVEWDVPKYVNYITFGGCFSNQPQPKTQWQVEYRLNDKWTTIQSGQGGWIDNGIFEWGSEKQAPVTADAIRVRLYSDGINDLVNIHLRARGGVSNGIDDSATTPKATLIQYIGGAARLHVDYTPASNVDLDVLIAAEDDDVEEKLSSGVMNLSSSDLELGYEGAQMVGLRFINVNIPAGATITNAYVQFVVDETNSGTAALTITGEATDNATVFTAATGNLSSRATTAASVPWSPASWLNVGDAGPAQQTVNIAAVIQEIVNRGGWSAGNALALLITGTGTRTAENFAGGAARLHVEYTP